MPNGNVDTGHGSTITLSSSGSSFNWTSIDPGEQSLGKVATSHLGTTGFAEFIAEDLTDPGEVTIEFQYDNEATQPSEGTGETLTITFPLGSGQTTAATLVGSGFIMRNKRPPLQTNTIQSGQMVFAFDGVTGPTFTAAS